MNNFDTKIPLAHQLKPANLDDIVGQEHLMGENSFLRRSLENNNIPSMILYGPPGCGKTSIAYIIAKISDSNFRLINAVSSGIKDLREVIAEAKKNKDSLFDKKTILFIDEIHRFNKKQQDYLLPFVEQGLIILIGATTENPSFEVVSALLSRTQVFVLNKITEDDILKILDNGIERLLDKRNISGGVAQKIRKNDFEFLKYISKISHGDARSALNILEKVILDTLNNQEISLESISNIAQNKFLFYDKDGEHHYQIISALHKSMRNSDVDASVYWTMRMIEGGEDLKFIVRRMIRFASEDVGNADPQALILAVATKETVNFLGFPESDTALVQLAAYLAKAPKDNSSYCAVSDCRSDIKRFGSLDVPEIIKNAESKLMEDWGYGEGSNYVHNFEENERAKKVDYHHLPKELENRKYYRNSSERKKDGKKDLW